MMLGIVRGTIVSTRKCDNLVGYRLLLIEPYYGNQAEIIVAADLLGSGIGDIVLLVNGSSARVAIERQVPVDTFIIGIVDAPPIIGK